MTILDFTLPEWEILDEKKRLNISKNLVSWNNLRRCDHTSIRKQVYHQDFSISFEVKVTELVTFLRSNRLMIVLFKLVKTMGDLVSVYVDKTKTHENKYRLVFHQFVNGKNEFVSVSPYLDLDEEYNVSIEKNEDKFRIKIFWYDNHVFEEEKLGINQEYNELVIAHSHEFAREPDDYSSGYLQNVNISGIEVLLNPMDAYNSLITHPRIVSVSRNLFGDGHYDDSVLKSYIEIEKMVKEKTNYPETNGKKLVGAGLMHHVFGGIAPILQLNDLTTDSEINEQKGYCKIFAGVMEGIRNPHSHDNIKLEPLEAIRYLNLANLLAEKVEQSRYSLP